MAFGSSAGPLVPPHDELFWPTVEALRRLGGSGTVQEIEDAVISAEGFSDEQQRMLTPDGKKPLIQYRLAWARTYLKNFGALENSGRAVWSLTDKGRSLSAADIKGIKAYVRQLFSKPRTAGDIPAFTEAAERAELESPDENALQSFSSTLF